MKAGKFAGTLGALALAAALATPAAAQDTDKKAAAKPDDAAMMAAMLELAKPGDNHKMLADTVGTWTYKIKFWMSPDTNAPPVEATGITRTRAVMGGRYFISEHRGKFPMPGPDGKTQEMDFNGMATEGYDNVKKKFISTWIDNMGTGIIYSEGDYNAAAKTLTYIGEEEPMPGMKSKVRQVFTYTDRDHHTLESFEVRGPVEVKTMEVAYTRSAGSAMRRPVPAPAASGTKATQQ